MNKTFCESASMTMRWIDGGIPIPEDIEDYNLYVAVIDGESRYLDYDGDNGIHAFDNDKLKIPYETRMRFLAVQIAPCLNIEYEQTYLQTILEEMPVRDIFAGYEKWFIDYAPNNDEEAIHKATLTFRNEVDYSGDVDEWVDDIKAES